MRIKYVSHELKEDLGQEVDFEEVLRKDIEFTARFEDRIIWFEIWDLR